VLAINIARKLYWRIVLGRSVCQYVLAALSCEREGINV
jgi:hypothetical protein